MRMESMVSSRVRSLGFFLNVDSKSSATSSKPFEYITCCWGKVGSTRARFSSESAGCSSNWWWNLNGALSSRSLRMSSAKQLVMMVCG